MHCNGQALVVWLLFGLSLYQIPGEMQYPKGKAVQTAVFSKAGGEGLETVSGLRACGNFRHMRIFRMHRYTGILLHAGRNTAVRRLSARRRRGDCNGCRRSGPCGQLCPVRMDHHQPLCRGGKPDLRAVPRGRGFARRGDGHDGTGRARRCGTGGVCGGSGARSCCARATS